MGNNKAFKFKVDDPLAIRRDLKIKETHNANKALLAYALMRGGRSLRLLHRQFTEQYRRYTSGDHAAGKPPTKSLTTVMGWSFKYRWVERVEIWDAIEADLAIARSRERQDQLLEAAWTDYEKLLDLSGQALDVGPSFLRDNRRTRDKGTPTVVNEAGEIIREGTPRVDVVTVAFDTTAVVKLRKLAEELGRGAIDLPTEHVKQTTVFEVSFDDETEEVLDA